MDDKRAFERFDIEVLARIGIPDGEKRRSPIVLSTDNLSAGGIFLKMDAPLPTGTTVKVEILFHFDELKRPEDPEGSLIIAVSGHVQRSGPEGSAICFDDDYEVLTALDLLEQRLGKVSCEPAMLDLN